MTSPMEATTRRHPGWMPISQRTLEPRPSTTSYHEYFYCEFNSHGNLESGPEGCIQMSVLAFASNCEQTHFSFKLPFRPFFQTSLPPPPSSLPPSLPPLPFLVGWSLSSGLVAVEVSNKKTFTNTLERLTQRSYSTGLTGMTSKKSLKKL